MYWIFMRIVPPRGSPSEAPRHKPDDGIARELKLSAAAMEPASGIESVANLSATSDNALKMLFRPMTICV